MPASQAIEPKFLPARRRWRVDVPATLSHTGRRVRVSFQSRQAARDYIVDISRAHDPRKSLDPRVAEDADTARARLDEAGFESVTLSEAVAELVTAKRALGDAGTLVKAAESAAAAQVASRPFGEAVSA